MIIAAKKGNTIYYAQIPVIAKLINKNPETVRRWKREGVDIKSVYDYIIYFDVQKL